MAIKFYKTKGKFGYLSNFYISYFTLLNTWWSSVEHAYQAQKAVNQDEFEKVKNAKSPLDARNLGQEILRKNDFEENKYKIMEDCVYAKFSQNEDLKNKLLSTGDEELIEDSPIDWDWGIGEDGTGKNNLGLILMRVRDRLRNA